jgi:arsenate reductase-like glutaredoxin family protein
MFINFVIDADNTDDIVKAIELLSYHLNNKEVELTQEDLKNLIASVPKEAQHIISQAGTLYLGLDQSEDRKKIIYKYITEELGKWKKENSDLAQPKDG